MVLSTDINKNFSWIIQKYKEKNILEFQQYPLKIIDLKRKYKGEKLKFVYCGTLIPPNDKNHPKELFNGTGLIYVFDYILRSGHELNIIYHLMELMSLINGFLI